MKHLTLDQCQRIALLMTRFSGPIHWSDVVDLGAEVTGHRFSRQALECKDVIRAAFDQVAQREQGKGQAKNEARKPAEIRVLEARIQRLEAELKLLKTAEAQKNEQFVLWAENARRRGLDLSQLNKPLSKIDRRATKE